MSISRLFKVERFKGRFHSKDCAMHQVHSVKKSSFSRKTRFSSARFPRVKFKALIQCLVLLSIFAFRTGFADIETEDFLPLDVGTTWVYRDLNNRFEKRTIKQVRRLEISPEFQEQIKAKFPGIRDEMVLFFYEMQVWDGTESELATAARGNLPPKQTFFFLRTQKGVLRSPAIGGEKGKEGSEFWLQAFFLLPSSLADDHVWQAYAFENRIDLEFHGREKVMVPLGTFDNCLNVSYRFGLEKDAWGQIDFCSGMGEVRVKEGDFVRELVQFTPGKKTPEGAKVLSSAMTEFFWTFLPQDKKISADLKNTKQHPSARKKFLGLPLVAWVVLVPGLLGLGWLLVKMAKKWANRPKAKHALDPEKFQGILEESRWLYEQGKMMEAEIKLLHLLVHHTEDRALQGRAFFQLGLVCESLGKTREAIENFEEVLEIEPKNPDVRLKLAHLFRSQKELFASYEHLRVFLKIKPDDSDIHNVCGLVLQEIGNVEKAREHFEKALSLNPHFHEARENIKALTPT